ncbi:HHR047Wp [Eremothecium sinecaudum]|uniref:Aminopeptidase n=1 Tax=Eremothecium sinecaudum TaxID=45286 RepID=A0A109V0H7_9SACH|nr:HHR047Wp [Eremothecium sinecaudum]AMD22816.1 HHR047Wp [Eremothecium sinecaudum]
MQIYKVLPTWVPMWFQHQVSTREMLGLLRRSAFGLRNPVVRSYTWQASRAVPLLFPTSTTLVRTPFPQHTAERTLITTTRPPCNKCEALRKKARDNMYNKFNVDDGGASDREALPVNVTPLRYGLQVEPDFEKFTFNGVVEIDLKVNDKTVDTIELNTADIDIKEARIGKAVALSTEYNEEYQRTKFTFPEGTLSDDNATLNITFVGILNNNMAGFYRAKYTDKVTGETKYMATTQMEPTDARRAFPCFDEPSLKAEFDVTLISEPKYTHLSNMDVKKEEICEGKKYTVFNTTPRMSTYLVAFIVAELRYVENNDFRIPIRVYATPGNEHEGHFAAALSAKTLEFFEKSFGIKYPLPKLDNVAVHEFSAGAMENWGLVTYRVVDLLLDREKATLGRIQRVAEVVQHELAHQWFGNLVTMDWWEGLWLNEGFATWMSWYSCNEFEPEWKVWEQYVPDTLQSALSLDALRSSHPIEVPVKRADEINQIFDAISYSKGSSLLRMTSKWLGEDVFVKGVSNYLNEFKYGNAKTTDLWQALSKESGKDVKQVMDIWTKKVGFPVITVEEEGGKLTFKQNRFLSTGDVKPEEDETIYPVFLSLKTNKGVDNSLVLDKRSMTIDLEDAEFFKVNAEQAGIYVTSYSDERWTKLASQAPHLSVEDRTGLVADVKTLASSGYTSTTNLLNLVSSWKNDNSFVVWNQIINSLQFFKSAWLFEKEEVNVAINAFIRDLVARKAHELGHEFSSEDTFAEQRLKVEMFGAACSAEDPETIAAALEMFEKYTAGDQHAIPVLIKPAVFNAAASKGGEENYNKLFNIYRNPHSNDEKLAALRSLGRFEDPELIKRTLCYLLDGTVLNQDIYIPIQGLRAHKPGILALWDWLQANWDDISERLPPSLSMLGSVVVLSTSGFTSAEHIEQIKSFFSTRSTKGFDQSLAQALDSITTKSHWVDRDRNNVEEYLRNIKYLQ